MLTAARLREDVAPAGLDWITAPLPTGPGQGGHQATLADLPVHSFSSLLADLATICLNTVQPADPAQPGFRLVTTPTPLQRQALDMLGVSSRTTGRHAGRNSRPGADDRLIPGRCGTGHDP